MCSTLRNTTDQEILSCWPGRMCIRLAEAWAYVMGDWINKALMDKMVQHIFKEEKKL